MQFCDCDRHRPGRRAFLGGAAAMALGCAAAGVAPTGARSGGRSPVARTTLTPDQVLKSPEGRQRKLPHGRALPRRAGPRAANRSSRAGQAPFCVLVGCSDSRVPPELLFGRGLGELFIVRNAGNTVNVAALGSVEYGVGVLGCPLVVVLGHEACGAVAAAVDVVEKNATFPGVIGDMIQPIVPAVLEARSMSGGTLLDNSIVANAKRVAKRLATQSAVLQERGTDRQAQDRPGALRPRQRPSGLLRVGRSSPGGGSTGAASAPILASDAPPPSSRPLLRHAARPSRGADPRRRLRARHLADAGRRDPRAVRGRAARGAARAAAADAGARPGDGAPARPAALRRGLRPAGAVRLLPARPPRRADPARPGDRARHATPPRDDAAAAALLPEMATGDAPPPRRRAQGAAEPRRRLAGGEARRRCRLALGAVGAGGARRAGRPPLDRCAEGLAPPAGLGGPGRRRRRRPPFPWRRARPGARLAAILGEAAEQRPQQADYASAAAAAFAPREASGAPHLVLAEAGTGTGKTLGYIAPASLWAERNGAPVWIATYTRNLQRQIDQELGRLYPEPEERRRRVVVRKGRENYLCLLNLEEVLGRAGDPHFAVPLGLVARWALATRDGDLLGGDFPGWITELHGPARDLPAGRPARRVHPLRLPALQAVLRRALHPPRPHARPWWWRTTRWSWCRRRRAAARTAGRSATCSTRATTSSTPPTPPSPRR